MYKKFLIIRLSSIGDVINAMPVADALKRQYKDAVVSWLVSPPCHEILRLMPNVDEIIIWNRHPFDNAVKNMNLPLAVKLLQQAKQLLSKYKFDAVLDIHSLLLTGILTKFLKADLKIGIDELREGNSFFMDKTVKIFDEIHKAKRYFSVLSGLNINADLLKPVVVFDESKIKNAKNFLMENDIDLSKKIVMVNLKTTWENKHYPMELFMEVIKKLDKDTEIIYSGTDGDKDAIERVKKDVKRGVSIAGKTNIEELFYVFKIADLLITVDSGPLHIAALADLKTVSLWGPTSPKMYAPLFGENHFIESDFHCTACNKRKCKLGDNLCMRAISPDIVANKANELLK